MAEAANRPDPPPATKPASSAAAGGPGASASAGPDAGAGAGAGTGSGAGHSASLYEQERRAKRQKLVEQGIDPYGGRVEGVRPLAEIKARFTPGMGHDGGPIVKGSGRVVLKRDMGKLSFLTLRDESGDLQVALDKKRLDEAGWVVRGLLDLGDLIVVEGQLGQTNKGETTVWATRVSMAAKALLPPPAKWEGLSDVELRYRQRYVDLWANPGVMRVLKTRIRVVEEIRRYMAARGFLEVETPMMQPLAGGAAARPFVTHHNALGIDLYLRIAPELYLKRLLVGGFTKVFELNRNFRNEGISPRHNPEFTMLEAYEAFGSWETMADLVEGMICHLAATVEGVPLAKPELTPEQRERVERRAWEIYASGAGGTAEEHWRQAERDVMRDHLKIEHRNAAGEVVKTIDLSRPWRRVSMASLVEERTGWKFNPVGEGPTEAEIQAFAQLRMNWVYNATDGISSAEQFALETASEGFDNQQPGFGRLVKDYQYAISRLSQAERLVWIYEKIVEPTLIDPYYVTHVPSIIIPLARKNKDNDFFADVYELAINGQEISPGYSELNDPDIQAANFATQVGDEAEKQKTDEDFLNALRYGMPPAGGMGLGIDRLVMMLTGAESIRDVILFPLMKPTE